MGALEELIAGELAQPVDPRVSDAATAIAALYPGARAVLFYGSCLRTGEIDGHMLDFYLIVRDYREAYGKRWLAWANRLIPPNVFPFERNGVAAKYAVLSEADFHRLVQPEASTVSVWARFAQPVRLVWAAEQGVASAITHIVANAIATLFQLTLPTLEGEVDDLSIWRRGFTLTYGAELRAERGDRPDHVIDLDVRRYQRVGEAALGDIAIAMGVGPNGEVPLFASPASTAARWRKLRRTGKLMTLARLAKASLTFAGGVDYLAWKINRHSGVGIVVKPWQRRFPLLGALILLPRLLRKGAVR